MINNYFISGQTYFARYWLDLLARVTNIHLFCKSACSLLAGNGKYYNLRKGVKNQTTTTAAKTKPMNKRRQKKKRDNTYAETG